MRVTHENGYLKLSGEKDFNVGFDFNTVKIIRTFCMRSAWRMVFDRASHWELNQPVHLKSVVGTWIIYQASIQLEDPKSAPTCIKHQV